MPVGRSLAFAARFPTPSLLCESEIMFGIGHWEILLIVLVIFILFGHRLPSVMRSLGRGIVEFKEGMSGTTKDDAVEERKDA